MGCRNSNLWGFFFPPCVLCRNRSRQEEVQKWFFGMSVRRAVKHCTPNANWLARNSTQNCVETQEWKEQRNHSLWRGLVQFLGRRMEGKGNCMGEKWEFSYFTESRSVTKQILFHSGCLQVIINSLLEVWGSSTLLWFLFQHGMDRECLVGVFGGADNWNIRILPNILLFI